MNYNLLLAAALSSVTEVIFVYSTSTIDTTDVTITFMLTVMQLAQSRCACFFMLANRKRLIQFMAMIIQFSSYEGHQISLRQALCQNEIVNKLRDKHAHPGVVGRKRKSDGTVVDLQAVVLESVIEKAQRVSSLMFLKGKEAH